MFEFLRIQLELGHITAEQLQGYAPRWITEAQAEAILQTDTK